MPKESLKDKKDRILKIIALFKKKYPNVRCALHFKNPLELLLATQLSAQCTDKRVNQVTKSLFKKYKTAKDYAQANLKDLEEMVRSTGFFRNKARNLKLSCESILNQHQGKVPKDFEKLTHLAGVGRKTAHVVMGNAFQIPSGVVVDTHVKRLAYRMGFVFTKNVHCIEKELQKLTPKKHWISFSHWMQAHGRQICTARRTYCKICFLNQLCSKKI